ncbi:MAG: amidohydrolase family protein [Phycisphaerales bacterium]|nr:amidohydrolase family protein [Phycisphaerales bacterium]
MPEADDIEAANPAHALETRRGRTLIRAAAVIDAAGVDAVPGVLLVDDGRLVAAGPPASVGTLADARVVEWPDALLTPGLVNAHAHLDLSHLPCTPFDGDFARWIDGVRRGRHQRAEAIAASVTDGVRLARRGGTAFIGDVAGAGQAAAVTALQRSGLGGVSFVELFGVGERQAAAIARMHELAAAVPPVAGGVRLGFQPHAPYSCGPDLYRAAAATGRPVSTHLAETPEEIEVLSGGGGPLEAFLRGIGVWDPVVGVVGRHPIDAVLAWMAGVPLLAAHVNEIRPEHLARLAAANVTVAYCPRASVYFGHPRPGHRPHAYAAMRAAGVNVALGTDGRPCLDTPERISVLDEMRLLRRRDDANPRDLLAMATVAGARGLGLSVDRVTLTPADGRGAGVLRFTIDPSADLDPLAQVLHGDEGPQWVLSAGAGTGTGVTEAAGETGG